MDEFSDQPQTPISDSEAAASMRHRETLFTGPYGLRSGWGLLIYASPIVVLFTIAWAAQHYMPHAKPAVPRSPSDARFLPTVIGEAITFGFFLFLSWIMSLIERRSLLVYGLGGREKAGRFLTGAAWGLLLLSALVGILWGMHLVVFDGRLLHGPAIVLWGAKWLLGFLLVGFAEEYVFRGYLQYTLTRGFIGLGNKISALHGRSIAFWIAGLLTSALFAFTHTGNKGETPLGIAVVSLAGITFCFALFRTGSLWWAIGFHTTWDWAQSFLYGVPDSGGLMQGRLFATHAAGNPLLSGGTVGPEGSILVLPTLGLAILILCFTHTSPPPSLEVRPRKPRLAAEVVHHTE